MNYATMVDLQALDATQTVTVILGPPAKVWATVAINRLTLLPIRVSKSGKKYSYDEGTLKEQSTGADVTAFDFGDISAYVLGYEYIDAKLKQELKQEFPIPMFPMPLEISMTAPSQLYIPAATKVTFGLFVGGLVYAAATAMVFSFGDPVGIKPERIKAGPIEPEPMKPLDACVVYDRSTGKVLHVHRIVCIGQQPVPPQGNVDGDALRYALQHVKRDKNQLDTLHVAELPHGTYKVNVETKELVQYNLRR